ncbi:uncharacterized protein BO97DRAFT_479477 [Aspergillus homomorphus CBS 101889]|uniref:Uncharacterized protein n=1 Tax=Aspergillus homomorphus (strain CBS 101889) TaxID=1450537 RepID=A0A395HR77_ASPHC|nr:hypothetical protein BO97DRAFT_479477 [Aspergillus homomorphus CBS 101889]RAL10260.1 hypothetical protein BO97DRAFT_479477 [Aspergillus homomorphus CBS 101889]
MKLTTLLLSLTATATATTTCYSGGPTSEGTSCISKLAIKDFWSLWYCNYRWNINYGDWDMWINNNESHVERGRVAKTGTFNGMEECLDAFKELVEPCYDVAQGGYLTTANVSLEANWCQW